jgi:ketosteroid isomerase-like protein
MSQENVELVRALQPSGVDLVAVTSGDQAAFGGLPDSLFGEDFSCSFTAEDTHARLGPYYGVEGLATAWHDWLEPWGRYEIHAERFLDAGDRVVAFVRIQARTHRDAVAVEHAPAAVWTLRDGKVRAIDFYLDRLEALEAVGLEE